MPETAVSVIDFEPRQIAIGDYDPKHYNMLIRGTTLLQTNPFLRPVVREVRLDQPGDTYPITQRKQGDDWVATEVGISAVGLFVLSDNAGIVDVPQASGRVDDGRDPGVCTYRATIAMRMPDGEWTFRTRECTVKVATLEKEIRAQKTAKAASQKGQYAWSAERVEQEIAKELLLKEKFMERLAETGAKTRAIRAILGIRTKYTPADMAKPFVFAAVVQDMSQPELRSRMLEQATSAIGAVFGPAGSSTGSAPRQLSAGPTLEDLETSDADVVEEGEPTGELSAAELGGAEASGRSAGPTDEPDWLKPKADATADAAAPATTKRRGAPSLAERLRESLDASELQGDATESQQLVLRDLVVDLPWATELYPVLVEAFGPEWDGRLDAAHAQAVINIAEAYAAAEPAIDFAAEWRKASAAARKAAG